KEWKLTTKWDQEVVVKAQVKNLGIGSVLIYLAKFSINIGPEDNDFNIKLQDKDDKETDLSIPYIYITDIKISFDKKSLLKKLSPTNLISKEVLPKNQNLIIFLKFDEGKKDKKNITFVFE